MGGKRPRSEEKGSSSSSTTSNGKSRGIGRAGGGGGSGSQGGMRDTAGRVGGNAGAGTIPKKVSCGGGCDVLLVDLPGTAEIFRGGGWAAGACGRSVGYSGRAHAY